MREVRLQPGSTPQTGLDWTGPGPEPDGEHFEEFTNSVDYL